MGMTYGLAYNQGTAKAQVMQQSKRKLCSRDGAQARLVCALVLVMGQSSNNVAAEDVDVRNQLREEVCDRQGWGINSIPDRIIDLKSKEEVIDRQCIHDIRRASSDIGTM
eukprot:scaffold1966_cov116-Skeletonema_dohrnii-CCMP3373.AAC.4